jgi:hypothetical protein
MRPRAVALVVVLAGLLGAAPAVLGATAVADGGTQPAAPTTLVTVSDPRISESSGLVASPTHDGLVWTVNDSGHTASVFGVSLSTGRTVAVLRLTDTDARDWEAMTAGRLPDGSGVLWIGDTGDNRAVRTSVVLRLVREPRRLPRAGSTVDVAPVSLRVRYPEGPQDVEALVMTRDGRLLLVTKALFAGTVYEVPPRAVATALSGTSVTEPVTARNVGGVRQSLVTDAASLPDGRIVLRGYVDAVVYSDRTRSDRGLEATQQVTLPTQDQGETLTVVDRGAALLVGSEGVKQPLWLVPLPAGPPTARSDAASTGSATASAGTPTSGKRGADDDRPAADRAPGSSGDQVLLWVLRVTALLLLPAAFLLGRRGRRTPVGRAIATDE